MQRAGLWERARVWRRPCSEIERAAATRGATRGRGASFADAATRCLIEHVEWMVVLLLHAANSGLRVATLRWIGCTGGCYSAYRRARVLRTLGVGRRNPDCGPHVSSCDSRGSSGACVMGWSGRESARSRAVCGVQ